MKRSTQEVVTAIPFRWRGRYPAGFWFIESTGAILTDLEAALCSNQYGDVWTMNRQRVLRAEPWELP